MVNQTFFFPLERLWWFLPPQMFFFFSLETKPVLANQLHFPFKTKSRCDWFRVVICATSCACAEVKSDATTCAVVCQATVRPRGRVRLSIRSPSLPQKAFLGCSALVTHTINKSCTGRHEMLMGSLAGFHSGRDTESYSHELFTPLELLCSVRWFSFCPQSQSCVPRPDWTLKANISV